MWTGIGSPSPSVHDVEIAISRRDKNGFIPSNVTATVSGCTAKVRCSASGSPWSAVAGDRSYDEVHVRHRPVDGGPDIVAPLRDELVHVRLASANAEAAARPRRFVGLSSATMPPAWTSVDVSDLGAAPVESGAWASAPRRLGAGKKCQRDDDGTSHAPDAWTRRSIVRSARHVRIGRANVLGDGCHRSSYPGRRIPFVEDHRDDGVL